METCTRIAIRNVLFPTDFSGESVQALDAIRRLHHHYQANVFVLHVLDLFPYALSSDPSAATKRNELHETACTRMREFAQAHQLKGQRYESAVLSGEICPVLEEFVNRHEIDLIVLGSRGDVGVSRLFNGSAAEEIFRSAHCPVMVVGPEAPGSTVNETFNHLLFATDLEHCSRAAIPYIEFLLRENPQARLSLAHFVEHEPGSVHERHMLRRHVERELTEMIAPALRHQIEDVIVEFSSPRLGILEIAENLKPDLLILGVRYGGAFTRAATHGLCNLTHQVISHSPCPVLTVRSS